MPSVDDDALAVISVADLRVLAVSMARLVPPRPPRRPTFGGTCHAIAIAIGTWTYLNNDYTPGRAFAVYVFSAAVLVAVDAVLSSFLGASSKGDDK